MRISAKVEYALRAMAELATHPADRPCRAEELSQAQDIPLKFLLGILGELKGAQLIRSHRGRVGGYQLARAPDQISLAEVARAMEGPLANVRDQSLHELEYRGAAAALKTVWMAMRTSLRDVLERVTLADLAGNALPEHVATMARRYQQEEKKRHPRARRKPAEAP
jgi:Rrf2 family protein